MLDPTKDRIKIFGIGLSRTGTKSLSSALMTLGVRVVHYPDDIDTLNDLYRGNFDFTILKSCDGMTDITTVPYYPQLDRLFPGSKFILTLRDKDEWLASMETHLNNGKVLTEAPFRNREEEVHIRTSRFIKAAVYGCYSFNRDRLSYVYDMHHQQVRSYFRDRPNDLLELNICAGEGWEKLCTFLRKPIEAIPFPHIIHESRPNLQLALS